MLLLNQVAKLPMAGLLLPKQLDFGIEKLKAGFPVRLNNFPLLPFAASAMTTTLPRVGASCSTVYLRTIAMTVSPSQIYKKSFLVTLYVHLDCNQFLSFSQAKNSSHFTPFDLSSVYFPKHRTLQDLPGGKTRVPVQLIMRFFLAEVKNLKKLVRDIVDPDRNLGHVDRNHNEKKPVSTSDEKAPASVRQSPDREAEESTQRFRRIVSLTNISKAPADGQEQTVPLDADATGARSAPSNGDGKQEERKEKTPGEIEPCDDCK